MGKVGSQSVHSSLTRLGLPSPIFHIHSLVRGVIRGEEEKLRRHWGPARAGDAVHVWQSQHVRRRLPALGQGERWRVVTLTRDPVARNVSHFFQIGQAQHLLGLSRGETVPPIADDELEPLRDFFLERFEGHDAPLTWFDHELKAVLGFDVYAMPFSASKGYAIYESDQVDVLVLRIEDLRARAEQAFREFFAFERFELIDTNIAEEKTYADLYRRFAKTVDLPDSYLSRMYNSKYAQHFYTEGELAAFKRSWERPRAS
jgi:Putative capsular polysaccharide synthesis protein